MLGKHNHSDVVNEEIKSNKRLALNPVPSNTKGTSFLSATTPDINNSQKNSQYGNLGINNNNINPSNQLDEENYNNNTDDWDNISTSIENYPKAHERQINQIETEKYERTRNESINVNNFDKQAEETKSHITIHENEQKIKEDKNPSEVVPETQFSQKNPLINTANNQVVQKREIFDGAPHKYLMLYMKATIGELNKENATADELKMAINQFTALCVTMNDYYFVPSSLVSESESAALADTYKTLYKKLSLTPSLNENLNYFKSLQSAIKPFIEGEIKNFSNHVLQIEYHINQSLIHQLSKAYKDERIELFTIREFTKNKDLDETMIETITRAFLCLSNSLTLEMNEIIQDKNTLVPDAQAKMVLLVNETMEILDIIKAMNLPPETEEKVNQYINDILLQLLIKSLGPDATTGLQKSLYQHFGLINNTTNNSNDIVKKMLITHPGSPTINTGSTVSDASLPKSNTSSVNIPCSYYKK